jgi:uncharacterized protein YaiL (DUF2058 family)
MSNSLRDQLLGLGFAAPKPEPRPKRDAPKPATKGGKPAHAGKPKPPHRKPPHQTRMPREDIDLAKAYAIRAQKEKDERIEAEKKKQEAARQRREAQARLARLVEGKALNDPSAEIARHFEYGGKIKRVHVNEAQLKALNAGELGVVQVNGRYLLLDAKLLAEAEQVFPQAVALKVDPDAAPEDDVPPDLVW